MDELTLWEAAANAALEVAVNGAREGWCLVCKRDLPYKTSGENLEHAPDCALAAYLAQPNLRSA